MNSVTEIDKLTLLKPAIIFLKDLSFVIFFFLIIHLLPMYYLDLGTDVNGVSGV